MPPCPPAARLPGFTAAVPSARLVALLCCAVLWLSGCATLPRPPGGTPSQALPATDTAATRLGRAIVPKLAAHPDQSAFYPLAEGPDALLVRLALARAAERSLDVQYYIFDADTTGKALVHELVAAADRGVRVRLLLDDLHVGGQDELLAVVDSHPDIEVRLFNPLANRGARWLDFMTDFRRVNRRMHNKSMTADNQLTVVGGRNIGDVYFSADPASDFTDLDVLAGGPVVQQVSAVFDAYWNSEAAYPVTTLARMPPDAATRLDAIRQSLEADAMQARATPYGQALMSSGMAQALAAGTLPEYWGRGSVIADDPRKVLQDPDDRAGHAMPELAQVLGSAQRELALVSPYFVPTDDAMDWLRNITARGVQVRILTNAYTATDVRAVHAGYAPRREALLKAGIELYELKPSAYAEMARHGRRTAISRSRASLHAKTYMVDQHLLFIGSLNLDPRSSLINTEMGVVLDNADLCRKLAINDAILDFAYKVMLEPDQQGRVRMVWVTRESGLLKTYTEEPGMGFWQRTGQAMLRLLPIEGEL